MANGETDELAGLCDALIDGTLTDEQKARLSQLIDSSEDNRQFYVCYLGLSASLIEYAGEQEFRPLKLPSDATPHSYRTKLWGSLIGLAAAAAIVLAVILPGSNDRDAEADADEFAAQITGLEDCTWASSKAPELGDQLRHGQHLELKSGIAEITFDSGAQVTLEGPAALELNSAWEATLQHGKLRAEVPTAAVGFGIQSATVDVVDMGAQFGMTVDANGTTDVGVFNGAVEATPRNDRGTKPVKFVLKEFNARRFIRTGSEEIKNAANLLGQFQKPTKLQRLAKFLKYVHWSFDDFDGRAAPADGTWATTSGLPALTIFSGDAEQNESRVDGKWQGALRFDGNLCAHATVPGFSARSAHTVAFWVRIPADGPLGDTGPMVSWLTNALELGHSQLVQIGWNSNPAQGPVGAARIELGRITAIGTSNLRDGQWHHVAAMIVPRSAGRLQWHARLYVDGHLEEAPNRNTKKPRADTLEQPTDDTVWLGCQANKAESHPSHFCGDLDELFIADRALPPPLVEQLFKQKSFASPTSAGKE
jgi:ferric-dicitrate binding protein FerR (iron transport regulator)